MRKTAVAPSAAGRAAVQPHIPGLARADKAARPARVSEAVLQNQTKAVLAGLGYACLEAGRARRRVACPCCGHTFVPGGWQGNTPGFPDLAVIRYVGGFPGVAALVELKGPGTPVRPEQRELADAGRSVIAHSILEAVLAVEAAEIAMDGYRFADAQRERIRRLVEMSGDKLR